MNTADELDRARAYKQQSGQYPEEFLTTIHRAAFEIRELQACIRALCNETEARKRLGFRVAEGVFDRPAKD